MLARAADVALLLIYGSVCFFFILRFALHRRPPSIGIALLPLGWIAISVHRLDLIDDDALTIFSWLGVGAGAFLLTVIVLGEARDPEGPTT